LSEVYTQCFEYRNFGAAMASLVKAILSHVVIFWFSFADICKLIDGIGKGIQNRWIS